MESSFPVKKLLRGLFSTHTSCIELCTILHLISRAATKATAFTFLVNLRGAQKRVEPSIQMLPEQRMRNSSRLRDYQFQTAGKNICGNEGDVPAYTSTLLLLIHLFFYLTNIS